MERAGRERGMGAQIEDERVERMEERLPRYPRETLPRVCTRGVEISSTDREVYGYAAATAACIRFGYGMRRSILSRRCRVKTCKRTAAAKRAAAARMGFTLRREDARCRKPFRTRNIFLDHPPYKHHEKRTTERSQTGVRRREIAETAQSSARTVSTAESERHARRETTVS